MSRSVGPAPGTGRLGAESGALERVRRRLAAAGPGRVVGGGEGWRSAGVLVPIRETPQGPAVILTRRGAGLAHHPGQVSFPGGLREAQDPSLEDTAVREAREEIGLDPDGLELCGALDEVWTPTGFILRPFVGLVWSPPRYVLQLEEVEEVIEAPIEALMDPRTFREELWERQGVRYPVVHFDLPGCTVWGATGRILARLLEVGFGWSSPGTGWEPPPLPSGPLRDLRPARVREGARPDPDL